MIRVVVVEGTSEAGAHFIRVYEANITSSAQRHLKKKLAAPGFKSEVSSLDSLWPGHAMLSLDDGNKYSQKRIFPFYGDWTFSTPEGVFDGTFYGNGVIYGVSKSEIVSATVSVEEVKAAVLDLC